MTQIHPEFSHCDTNTNEAREHSQIHNTTHTTGIDATVLLITLGVMLFVLAISIMVNIWSVTTMNHAQASIQYYERAFKACNP